MEEVVIKEKDVTKVAKALASVTRWEILKLLRDKKMDISRIAEALKQTEANISAQVKILEKAGLIRSYYEPGAHGVRKVCELGLERLIINVK